MPAPLAVINLGELSKPATVLIEKVSDAVGGIAKPWQIKRVAQAEVEANIIREQGAIQISDLQRRAIVRMIREEGQKQENIESITTKAIPDVRDDAKPEDIEKDWLSHFFDKCRLISDVEMQALWAKILAAQANKPGTYSKRTVDLVAVLDKKDAELFANLCNFIWTIKDPTPLIYNPKAKIYTEKGITYSALNHLESIGLISFHTPIGFSLTNRKKITTISYFDKKVTIELPDEFNNFSVGKVLLTKVGEELAGICGASPSAEFFTYVLGLWERKGYKITRHPS